LVYLFLEQLIINNIRFILLRGVCIIEQAIKYIKEHKLLCDIPLRLASIIIPVRSIEPCVGLVAELGEGKDLLIGYILIVNVIVGLVDAHALTGGDGRHCIIASDVCLRGIQEL
jgi:hypothetical protein